MALIYNASAVDQKVKVFGNWFEIPVGKIKSFNDNVAHFLATDRKDHGLVALDSKFEEMEYRDSEEGKMELAKAKATGVENRINYLKSLIHNETVSLAQDLAKANMNIDSRLFMSEPMIKNMEELASYKKLEQDAAESKLAKVKELEQKLKGF